jgi:hypothetical protein
MAPRPDRPSDAELLDAIAEYGSPTQAAQALGFPKSTFTDWCKGLTGENLQLQRISVNASGGVSRGYKPQLSFIAPPTLPGDWTTPKRPKANTKKPRTWALLSDIHCPFHDEDLLGAACAWLAANQPTDGIINGDLLDFPDLSKYLDKEDWVADVNKCLRVACRYLKALVDASPQTRWKFAPGNHEKRLPDYIISKAPALWGIRPGGDEEFLRWHDLRNLLLLDKFGIEFHPEGYPDAEIALTPKFIVTHGDYTKKNSGNSAHAALERADHSFGQGHDHRIAQVFKTKWGADGKPSVHVGIQMGCMAAVDVRGLGYAKKPDWQQGFAIVHTWPDGLFSAQLAVFVEKTLLVGSDRY